MRRNAALWRQNTRESWETNLCHAGPQEAGTERRIESTTSYRPPPSAREVQGALHMSHLGLFDYANTLFVTRAFAGDEPVCLRVSRRRGCFILEIASSILFGVLGSYSRDLHAWAGQRCHERAAAFVFSSLRTE